MGLNVSRVPGKAADIVKCLEVGDLGRLKEDAEKKGGKVHDRGWK